MSAQDLEVLDHTVQLTHEWINEARERLGWRSSRDALRLLRVTLTELRDRLSHEEAAQLSAQMPLLIRGMFFEGWQPDRTPTRDRDAGRFLDAIADKVGNVDDWRGARDVEAVFATLENRISAGELSDVRQSLGRRIRELWPADFGMG